MANAKKCDRCGAYYDHNNGVESIRGNFVVGVKVVTTIDVSHKSFDLCDDCIEKLYGFLRMEDKEE